MTNQTSHSNPFITNATHDIMSGLNDLFTDIRTASKRRSDKERAEQIAYSVSVELGRASAMEQTGKNANGHRLAALGMALGAVTDSNLQAAFVDQIHQLGILVEQEMTWFKSLVSQLNNFDPSQRSTVLAPVVAQTDNLQTLLSATRLGSEA